MSKGRKNGDGGKREKQSKFENSFVKSVQSSAVDLVSDLKIIFGIYIPFLHPSTIIVIINSNNNNSRYTSIAANFL